MRNTRQQSGFLRLDTRLATPLSSNYRLVDYLLKAVSGLRCYNARRKEARRYERQIVLTLEELSRMQDPVLHDLGLARANLVATSAALVSHPGRFPRELDRV